MSVVMAHYTPATLFTDQEKSPYLFGFVHIFSIANIGVLFFFGLSAFLLSWRAETEIAANGLFDRLRFLQHRFFRIVPVYVVVLALSLILLRSNGWLPNFGPNEDATRRYSIEHLWLYLAFLYNWPTAFMGLNRFNPPFFNELGHLWSLSVEVQFYIVFALFFPLVRRHSWTFWRSLSLAAACGILARAAFLLVIGHYSANRPAGYLYFYPFSYTEVFLVSSSAGIVFAHWDECSVRFRALAKRGAGAAVLIVFAAAGWTWKNFLWNPPDPPGRLQPGLFYGIEILHYTFLGVLVAVSLIWIAANSQSKLCGFLRLPMVRALGTLSYGLYLWHLTAKFALFGVDKRLLANLAGDRRILGVLLMFIIYVAVVVGLAGLTYWAVEMPFNGIRQALDSKAPQDGRRKGLGTSPYPLIGWSLCSGGIALAAIVSLHA